jgi:hypothetical protein
MRKPSWEDLDRLLFHFWTPTFARRDPPATGPMGIHVPQVQGAWQPPELPGSRPPTDPPRCSLAVPARLPAWQVPNFWATPLPISGRICVPWYETWTTIITFDVPDTHMVLIDRVAIAFPLPRQFYEILEVRVLRNQLELARWEEQVTRAASAWEPEVDMATGVAFGGLLDPIPFFGRFAQNDRIEVQVMAKGRVSLDPTTGADVYQHASDNVYGGIVYAQLEGWMASLMDTRDGSPRPVDTACMRDDQGRPIVNSPEMLQLAERLMAALKVAS